LNLTSVFSGLNFAAEIVYFLQNSMPDGTKQIFAINLHVSFFSLFSLVKCWIQIETNFRAEVDDFNGKNYKKFNRQQLGQLCTSLYIVEASVPIIESNYWYFLHDCFSFVLYRMSFFQGLNPADIL